MTVVPVVVTPSAKVALFDLDGTLTKPRQKATPDMLGFLKELRQHVKTGVVSGSDLPKITEQLGCDPSELFDYVFSENGVVAHKDSKLIGSSSISSHLGESKLKKLINFVLKHFSEIEEIPVKRGTFIEYRTGMLNFSPIGRSCSQSERLEFFEFDKVHKVRETFVAALYREFPKEDFGLQFSIGGQISVDCFPLGWDKTFCLQFLKEFEDIHFFGDMTHPGGNDHEIFAHPETQGHTVTDPQDCMKQVEEIFQF
jgi:phosphomannomutase